MQATDEAEQIVARAQQQAATIDERARQEFAWRRRQMRHEQDLLNRRKQAMLSQLTSLSALAVRDGRESAARFRSWTCGAGDFAGRAVPAETQSTPS